MPKMSDSSDESAASAWSALLWQQGTRLVVCHAGTVLAISISLALMAIVVAGTSLQFQANPRDPLTGHAEFERRWQAYCAEFGEQEDTVIVLSGKDSLALEQAVNRLENELKYPGRPFENVLAAADLSSLRAKAMHYLPLAHLQACEQLLQQRSHLLSNLAGFQGQLAALRNALGEQSTPAEQAARCTELNSWLEKFAREATASPLIDEEGLLRENQRAIAGFVHRPLVSLDQRQAYLYLKLRGEINEFLPAAAAIASLRRLLADVQNDHPQIQISLTGQPIQAHEEQVRWLSILVKAGGLTLLGTCLLLCVGFGVGRHSGAVAIALFTGLGWWLGYLTLTVGHVSVFHGMCVACVIPISLACAVYYLAHYLELRKRGKEVDAALAETACTLGPRMGLTCITAALGLLILRLTPSAPLAEFGMIAGGGILLGLLATIITLPATLHLFDIHAEGAIENHTLCIAPWSWPAQRFPLSMIGLATIGICCTLPGLGKLSFDFFSANNSSEQATIERAMQVANGHAPECGYVLCNSPEQAEQLQQQLTTLAAVARVDQLSPSFPADDPQKRRVIVKMGTLLEQLSQQPSSISTHLGSLETELERTFAALKRGDVPAELSGRLQPAYQQLLASAAPEANQESMLPQWISLLPFLDPAAPQMQELPPEMVSRSVGKQGKVLLRVYPREDISQRVALHRFVTETEQLAPQITGQPLNRWYQGRRLQATCLQASLYSLLVVAMVGLVTLRSIGRTCWMLAPSILGLTLMFALAGECGLSLTAASWLAWPVVLMLGACHGQLFAAECERFQSPHTLRNTFALAATLSTAVVLLGITPLLGAAHAELQSLGQLVAFGVAGCWGTSLFILPAWLRRLSQHLPAAKTAASEAMNAIEITARVRPRRRVAPVEINSPDRRDRAA